MDYKSANKVRYDVTISEEVAILFNETVRQHNGSRKKSMVMEDLMKMYIEEFHQPIEVRPDVESLEVSEYLPLSMTA